MPGRLVLPAGTAAPTETSAPTAAPSQTPTATVTATSTPLPLALSVMLAPEMISQGEFATLVIEANRPTTVTASLRGEPLPLWRDGQRWYALVGAQATTEPAAWPIVVAAEDPLGGPGAIEQAQLRIVAQEFGSEAIDMPQSALDLVLDAEAARKEAQLIRELTTPRTPSRLWQEPFQQPVEGEVSSPYGIQRSYNGAPPSEHHSGLDLAIAEGVPVGAMSAGHVVFAGPLVVHGDVVIIDHGWGLFSGYHHLSAVAVSAGQSVERGDTIGFVGTTGFSTGPHLHWTVWVAGEPVNPLYLLQWQFPE